MLSGDGARAAAAVPVASNRTDLVVLDTRTLRPLFTRPIPAQDVVTPLIWPLALNRDGTRLAESVRLISPDEKKGNPPGLRGVLRVREIDTGRLMFTHEDAIDGPNAFGSVIKIEGSNVARLDSVYQRKPGAPQESESDLAIWDADTGAELLHKVVRTPQLIRSLVIRPDGAAVFGSLIEQREANLQATSTLREWELATGRERTIGPPVDGHLFLWAYNPDGTRLATLRRTMQPGQTMEGMLTVLDTTTGAELFTLRDLGPIPHTAAFSPDGRILAAGNDVNTCVNLVDATTGRSLRVLHGHAAYVGALAFRTEGAGLVSIDHRGTLKEWDLGAPRSIPLAASRWPEMSRPPLSAAHNRGWHSQGRTPRRKPGRSRLKKRPQVGRGGA